MKRIVAMFCALLLLVSCALAEEAVPEAGRYARDTETAALLAGYEVKTETSFAWAGLPLFEKEENDMLKSLLKVLSISSRRYGGDEAGYRALDFFLKDVSVLDLSIQVLGGIYYEQSNLLGGQVVAFTPEAFRSFVARISSRSGGALPVNLDGLFAVIVQMLAGTEIPIDEKTESEALSVYLNWQSQALVRQEVLRPVVQIPGLYGTRAEVIEVTRAEVLQFAEAYSNLLSENEVLWKEAAATQMPGANDEALTALAREIGETMRGLPETLKAALPANLQPSEYREVFDAEGRHIVSQLELYLPDNARVYLEWVPRETGIPPMYASLTLGGSVLSVVITREDGMSSVSGNEARVVNKLYAQITYVEPGTQLDVVVTHSEDARTRNGQETVVRVTDVMLDSAALLGEGTIVTLTGESVESTSGAIGAKYARTDETVWRLKGLGFDEQSFLTVSTRTTLGDANPPVGDVVAAVYPAQMDDEALDAWLADIDVGLLQTVYTILGRLPSDVAVYLLSRMNAE